VSSQGKSVTLEDTAKLRRAGMRYFDSSLPMPTENSPPFVQTLMSSLMLRGDKSSREKYFKTYGTLFSKRLTPAVLKN
jgi:hypothetical protein